MNTVKNWVAIYESEQEVRIESMLKGLYRTKDWQELHVALWAWLSLDGEREKWEWFYEFDVPEVKQHCFACEQAEISFYFPPTKSTPDDDRVATNYCYYCPLTNSTSDLCGTGLYDQWCFAEDLERREELAREIANLEWNIK